MRTQGANVLLLFSTLLNFVVPEGINHSAGILMGAEVALTQIGKGDTSVILTALVSYDKRVASSQVVARWHGNCAEGERVILKLPVKFTEKQTETKSKAALNSSLQDG